MRKTGYQSLVNGDIGGCIFLLGYRSVNIYLLIMSREAEMMDVDALYLGNNATIISQTTDNLYFQVKIKLQVRLGNHKNGQK